MKLCPPFMIIELNFFHIASPISRARNSALLVGLASEYFKHIKTVTLFSLLLFPVNAARKLK
jgi:hypothetical protein